MEAAIYHFGLWGWLWFLATWWGGWTVPQEDHVVQLYHVRRLELWIQHISTAKVLLRKFNRNTRYPGVSGEELHHWKPAVGVVAMLAPFLSVLASKQGSALLHIPDRWTTHGRIKLSAGRNLFQRLYRCRCSSERKLGRMQHRDFESNMLLIWRGLSTTVRKCRGPSSWNVTCPSKSNYLSRTSTRMPTSKHFLAAERTQSDITLRKDTTVLFVQWTHTADIVLI